MNDIPYGAQTPFLRLLHPELERDYEDDDELIVDGKTTVYCPYCGGAGTQEWFEKHEHENPFGDEQ